MTASSNVTTHHDPFDCHCLWCRKVKKRLLRDMARVRKILGRGPRFVDMLAKMLAGHQVSEPPREK